MDHLKIIRFWKECCIQPFIVTTLVDYEKAFHKVEIEASRGKDPKMRLSEWSCDYQYLLPSRYRESSEVLDGR